MARVPGVRIVARVTGVRRVAIVAIMTRVSRMRVVTRVRIGARVSRMRVVTRVRIGARVSRVRVVTRVRIGARVADVRIVTDVLAVGREAAMARVFAVSIVMLVGDDASGEAVSRHPDVLRRRFAGGHLVDVRLSVLRHGDIPFVDALGPTLYPKGVFPRWCRPETKKARTGRFGPSS